MSEPNQEPQQVLFEVFSDVAEKLAFMFSEMVEEDEITPPDGECLCAHMGFEGPFNGELLLVVPEEMCSDLAANVLGLDPTDPMLNETATHDALKELLNVTCGHVLTSLAGKEPVFDLTVPEVSAVAVEEWSQLAGAAETCRMLLDDQPVLLKLNMEA